MEDLLKAVAQANEIEVEELLKAVLERYERLYPGWELRTISLQKNTDINDQIERTIKLLKELKTNASESQ